MSERTTIEFTDRYGGHAPSWLRGCHGDCEATGYVPHKPRWWHDNRAVAERLVQMYSALPPARDVYYDTFWVEAEAADPQDDGWHFVRCYDCGGTGSVSWLVTVARVPNWIWKGVRFIGGVTPEMCVPGTSWLAFKWLAFKCAFLADLGVWRP